jgi:hypothetical protein
LHRAQDDTECIPFDLTSPISGQQSALYKLMYLVYYTVQTENTFIEITRNLQKAVDQCKPLAHNIVQDVQEMLLLPVS